MSIHCSHFAPPSLCPVCLGASQVTDVENEEQSGSSSPMQVSEEFYEEYVLEVEESEGEASDSSSVEEREYTLDEQKDFLHQLYTNVLIDRLENQSKVKFFDAFPVELIKFVPNQGRPKVYTITESLGVLGKGSFGRVEKVAALVNKIQKDGTLYIGPKNYAIKFFPGEAGFERCKAEMEAYDLLYQHITQEDKDQRGLVRPYRTVFCKEGEYGLLLKCYQGTLKDFLPQKEQGLLPPSTVLSFGVDLALGCYLLSGGEKYASLSTTFCDLKPENIFMKTEGVARAYIGDFGALQILKRDDMTEEEMEKMVSHAVPWGTAHYFPYVEGVKMHARFSFLYRAKGSVDLATCRNVVGQLQGCFHRARQFSLGVILYEMMTGKRFPRESSSVFLSQIPEDELKIFGLKEYFTKHQHASCNVTIDMIKKELEETYYLTYRNAALVKLVYELVTPREEGGRLLCMKSVANFLSDLIEGKGLVSTS